MRLVDSVNPAVPGLVMASGGDGDLHGSNSTNQVRGSTRGSDHPPLPWGDHRAGHCDPRGLGGHHPLVGPYFHYAFGSYTAFSFTWDRLWLDVLPGVAAVIGGAMLVSAATRPTAVLGGWLGAAAGAWFAVGTALSILWEGAVPGGIGLPLGGPVLVAVELIGFFYGLGVAIALLAAFATGRVSVRSVKDVDTATRRAEERDQQSGAPRVKAGGGEGARQPLY